MSVEVAIDAGFEIEAQGAPHLGALLARDGGEDRLVIGGQIAGKTGIDALDLPPAVGNRSATQFHRRTALGAGERDRRRREPVDRLGAADNAAADAESGRDQGRSEQGGPNLAERKQALDGPLLALGNQHGAALAAAGRYSFAPFGQMK